MTETFGFTQEILLVYSPYTTLEPRTIMAAEEILNAPPAKGRVEGLTYFLVSSMRTAVDWTQEYMTANRESRLIVAFSAHDLKGQRGESFDWYVRNKIMQQLFSRDLFDYRLPLEKDTYFFGRDDLLMDYRDAARRGENRGIFGLRKTGKTSFLFRLENLLQQERTVTLYYDCKSPSVRQLNWHELLRDICRDVAGVFNLKFDIPSDIRYFSSRFSSLLSSVRSDRRIALIFDEIEYISPFSQDDRHWRKEYIPFWQTIWAAQSRHRNLFVVLAGVNPSIVEIDKIENVQNPLFGIFPYRFLTGLRLEETRRMLRALGRRMGLRFDSDATIYIQKRYGGHPLLTRLACSHVHQTFYDKGLTRPIVVGLTELLHDEGRRDADLSFYCRHVVSELRDFYPEEYTLLEHLAVGRTDEFRDLSRYPESVNHLRSYGLVSSSEEQPGIVISVVGRYVALESARRDGRKTIMEVVPSEDREHWLGRRITTILSDIGELERLGVSNNLPCLYGPNSIPSSHLLTLQRVVTTEDEFTAFISRFHKCLVEGVDNYGRHLARRRYFWEVRASFPNVHAALHRIRLYRNWRTHELLSPQVQKNVDRLFRSDLEGRRLEEVEEVWFVLQQCVLDSLHLALQSDISHLSK